MKTIKTKNKRLKLRLDRPLNNFPKKKQIVFTNLLKR